MFIKGFFTDSHHYFPQYFLTGVLLFTFKASLVFIWAIELHIVTVTLQVVATVFEEYKHFIFNNNVTSLPSPFLFSLHFTELSENYRMLVREIIFMLLNILKYIWLYRMYLLFMHLCTGINNKKRPWSEERARREMGEVGEGKKRRWFNYIVISKNVSVQIFE